LCGGALAVAALSALLTWFGVVRATGTPPLAYWLLVAAVAGVGVSGVAFLLLRRRLYERVPAPRLLFASLALVLPLLGVELVANALDPGGYLYFAECQRYFAGQRYEGVLPDHAHPPDYRLRYPWGEVTTNAEGWRSPAVALAKPPGTLRVLGLGDSVLFSWGVSDADTVTRRLEEALTASLDGRRVEVINTGNGSFNSLDELLVLRSRGLDYAPDAVFVLVIGNDFYDRPPYVDQVDWLEAQGVRAEGALDAWRRAQVERPGVQGPRGLGRGLFLGTSYLINRSFLVVQGVRTLRALTASRVAATAPLGQVSASPPSPTPAGSGPQVVRPPREAAAVTTSTPAGQGGASAELARRYPYLESQVAALREIDATCRQAGIPLVVFVFTDNLGGTALSGHLLETLGERVVTLSYPDPVERDPNSLVNSATDPHWNPEGVRYFVGQMTPPLLKTLGLGEGGGR
jgi:hypothetical protein